MDYKEMYEKAIKRAKAMIQVAANQEEIYNSVITIFPELKESEDERIRKELIAFLKENLETGRADETWSMSGLERWIAWLEKQGDASRTYELGFTEGQRIERKWWLEKQGEQKEYTFKSLPRLLDMIEPTSKAKAYCQKLIDALVKEGYTTDAKIVGECLKAMNGENVPMAIMDEKQGEQTPTESSDIKSVLLVHDETLNNILERYKTSVTFKPLIVNLQNWWNNTRRHLFSLNIEQKTADKVEPKFHEGDWVVSKLDRKARQISEVHCDEYNDYYIVEGDEYQIEEYDRLHHLWTIQDAKDGDVLVIESGRITLECLFIFKGIANREVLEHCYYRINDNTFSPTGSFIGYLDNVYHPATKEQSNLLFNKMHEAGYEWDAEKKELKKVEQELIDESSTFKNKLLELFQKFRYIKEGVPTNGDIIEYVDAHIQELIGTIQNKAWSEDDEKYVKDLVAYFTGGLSLKHSEEDIVNWLKSLKDRVQPQPKREWSEEDEQYLLVCKNALAKYQTTDKWDADIISYWLENKLKSLRPQSQWKPSKEQIMALRWVLNNVPYNKHKEEISGLLEQLNELNK